MTPQPSPSNVHTTVGSGQKQFEVELTAHEGGGSSSLYIHSPSRHAIDRIEVRVFMDIEQLTELRDAIDKALREHQYPEGWRPPKEVADRAR